MTATLRPHSLVARILGWFVLSAVVGACLVGWWVDASLAGRERSVTSVGRVDALHLRAETPVLSGDGRTIASAARPAATNGVPIALTFSGGRDDRWNARVAALLDERDIAATFFVTGQALIEHPGRVRSLERSGHEIGANGYSEVDLANLDDWQVRLHLTTTESLLTTTTGRYSRLFRPPGAQPLRGLDAADLHLARVAMGSGYTVVLADRVASVWTERSPTRTIREVLPAEGTSAVIEFPTPPPERQDDAANVLEYVVAALQQRGDAFVTVSEYAGLTDDALHPVAPSGERRRGAVLAAALPVLGSARAAVHALAVVLLALGLIRVVLAMVVAVRARRRPVEPPVPAAFDRPVTVIIAARDEAPSIGRTLTALQASTQRTLEILVVDDGSTDGTAEIVEATVPVRPGVTIVLERQGGLGKSWALNAGMLVATHELIVCIDADTVVEPETITRLVEPLLDPEIGAVSGHVLVDNPRGLLGRFQRAEYAVGCSVERRLLNRAGFMTCVSGAVGAYRRSAVTGVGGFSSDTCAEDTDLALTLQRAGWGAVYAPEARAHTTVPSSVRGLWTQRVRWSLGVAQSMWKHRRGLRDRGRSGWVGRRALPYLVVFGALSVLGPVVDAVAIFAVLTARLDQLVAVWAVLVGLTTTLTAVAFAIEGQPIRRAWIVPLQIVLYRPFLYLAQLRALQVASVGLRPAWRRRRSAAPPPAPRTAVLDDSWVSEAFELFAAHSVRDAARPPAYRRDPPPFDPEWFDREFAAIGDSEGRT